jgi:glycine/D-amino acid oxidase-like deaminating enzyme
MSQAHVIIIGGGIVGTACAQRLAATGWRVTLIERDTIGSGATAAGMGQVVALDDSPAELALTADSQRRWHALCASQSPRPRIHPVWHDLGSK